MSPRHAPQRVIAAALLWASSGVVACVAPAGISAPAFGAARLLVGGAALALAMPPRQLAASLPALLRPQLLVACMAMALFQWSFFAAVSGAGVGIAGLVSAVGAPFFADAFAAAAGRMRLSPQWRIAALCGVAGIALLGMSGRVGGAGLAQALLSAFAYAAYTHAVASLERARPAAGLAGTIVALLGAGLMLLPLGAAHLPALLTPRGLAVIAYLGIVATALAYRLYVTGLRQLTPGGALMLLYLQPASAWLMGELILHEHLDRHALPGALHVVTAAFLHWRASQHRHDCRVH